MKRSFFALILMLTVPMAFATDHAYYSPGAYAARYECEHMDPANTGFKCSIVDVTIDPSTNTARLYKNGYPIIFIEQQPIPANASVQERERLRDEMATFIVRLRSDGITLYAVHWASDPAGKMTVFRT